MKKIAFVIWLLILIFIGSVLLSLFYMQKNARKSWDHQLGQTAQNRLYHFTVILFSQDDPFFQGVKNGIEKAADDFHVAVEIQDPFPSRIKDETYKYLEIAFLSQVDGVILYISNERQLSPLINQIVESGIPVITIETDAPSSKRNGFVGTNRYQIGQEEARLILEATGGRGQIALILDNKEFEAGRLENNLIFAGLKSTIKDHPHLKIDTIKFSSTGLFSAEEITKDLMMNYPQVDIILCTNAKDTVASTQAIIDFNKVGEFTIIGFGSTRRILDYIRKGVVYGTVARNPENIGYSSVKALMELKAAHNTSSFVDTGVYVITKANVGQYLEKR